MHTVRVCSAGQSSAQPGKSSVVNMAAAESKG